MTDERQERFRAFLDRAAEERAAYSRWYDKTSYCTEAGFPYDRSGEYNRIDVGGVRPRRRDALKVLRGTYKPRIWVRYHYVKQAQ